MKAKERHDLKQNEIAELAMRAMAWYEGNRTRAAGIAGAALAVAVLASGYVWWLQRTANEAGALLGTAVAIAQAPIAPAPTVAGAAQQSGTFPSEAARLEAALEAYRAVIDGYPGSEAALSAQYAMANALLAAGRAAEAEEVFGAVIAGAGSSLQGSLGRLGRGQALAAQGKHEDAIALLTELSADRESRLPVDGILIQLARTSAKAGRTDDARAAFRRIVDEFPSSAFAAEARQELARLG